MKIPSWSHGPASAIGRYFLRFAKFAYLNIYDLTVSSNKTRVEQSRMHSGNINKQSRPDGTIRKLYKHIGTLLGDAAGVRRSRPALSISVQFIQTIARVLAHLCASLHTCVQAQGRPVGPLRRPTVWTKSTKVRLVRRTRLPAGQAHLDTTGATALACAF